MKNTEQHESTMLLSKMSHDFVFGTLLERSYILLIFYRIEELHLLFSSTHSFSDWQAKILDHDNVNYLKKILGELAMLLDQVEAELEKRKLEYQGTAKSLPQRALNISSRIHFNVCPNRSKV